MTLPWARLPLPDEVLEKTKADLSDVRLLDAEGLAVAVLGGLALKRSRQAPG